MKSLQLGEAITLYLETVRKVDSDMRFNASHVCEWAKAYKEQASAAGYEVDLPSEIFNPYSVGKYLKSAMNILGITNVGSYANRQVYALTA